MPNAQDIYLTSEQFPILAEFLEDLPSAIVSRGAALMRERAVRSIVWTAPGHVLEAKIQGSRLYSTQLFISENSASTRCSCDEAEDCKHGAALVLELRKHASEAKPKPHSYGSPAFADVASTPKVPADSLSGFVQAKFSTSLNKTVIGFLDRAEKLWNSKQRVIEQSLLHELCGRQRYWGYGQIELYPAELEPKTGNEFLAFLANALAKCQLPLPAPLEKAVDWILLKEIEKKWQQLREVQVWRQSMAQWNEVIMHEDQEAPELRFFLLPTAVIVQLKNPDEAEFGKATQKRLKEISQEYRGSSNAILSAGSNLVLRAISDQYGGIRSLEIQAMSENLTKSLTQLASRPELFHAHVCSSSGGELEFVEEPLRWELTQPLGKTGDYALKLLDSKGITPVPPVAVLPGNPLRYVTAERVYHLPYWPFGKERLEWPVIIPAGAIESREGVSALGKLGVAVPERLAGKVRQVKAVVDVRCKVARYSGNSAEYLHVSGRATYGGAAQPSDWNGMAWQTAYSVSWQAEKPSEELIQMDKSIMPAAVAWLRQMPMKVATHSENRIWVEQRMAGKEWPDHFLAWLDRRPRGLDVSLDKELTNLKNGSIAGQVRLDVEESKSGMDWFDLSVALTVTDTTLTPEEIALLMKSKGKWVKLPDKGWRKLVFDLTEEQQKELADLGLAVNDFDGSKQKLHALQLGALTKGSSLLPAERAEQVQRRVEDIQMRITPDLPSSITATLRPYQLNGFHFLAYLTANGFGGVLADDMGLGKTLQTLAWVAWLRAEKKLKEPILVVCPKSVQDNWRSEVQRFCPSMKVEVWSRETAGKTGLKNNADILVIHYPQLRIHEDILCKITWGAVILDEAQAIKNPTAQSTKAACALNARHRLALTGTPIENRLLDLWSIFAFAMPGVLGSRAAFARDFDGKEDPFARRRLAARTRPFLLRRTKKEVATDLPDRVEEDLVIEMEGTQAKLYAAEIKRARAQLLKAETNQQLDKLRFNILTSLLRLRQICCHPRLLGLEADAVPAKTKKKKSEQSQPSSESAKVSALMELIEQLTEDGQKVLVFSQFVEMLEIIQEEITARQWHSFKLTGQTEDRGALVKAFQEYEGPATFLISLKAGGFGLNLTAASYVVLFDPWWNPAVEAQAIDRTHRIGQKQTVFAYRLLIKDSIEEKIRLLQKKKGDIANDILGEENFAQALTLSDFNFLLGDG